MSDKLPADGEKPNAEAQKPIAVNGIGEHEYAVWRNHPVTLMVRQYLADFRADLIQSIIDQWVAGTLQLSNEHEHRGWTNALKEMSDIEFGSIAKFYADLEQMREEQK